MGGKLTLVDYRPNPAELNPRIARIGKLVELTPG